MFINNNKSVTEKIQFAVDNSTNNDKKLELLRKLNDRGMKYIVSLAYIRDLTNVEVPEYTPCELDYDLCRAKLSNSVNRIESAIRLASKDPEKSKNLFILVLQDLPKDDAQLLVDVIQGKKFNGVSKAVWKRMYPDFFRS